MLLSAGKMIGGVMVRLNGREIACSTPARALLRNSLGQAVHTLAPLSPSSITWQRCKTEMVTADYERLPLVTLGRMGISTTRYVIEP